MSRSKVRKKETKQTVRFDFCCHSLYRSVALSKCKYVPLSTSVCVFVSVRILAHACVFSLIPINLSLSILPNSNVPIFISSNLLLLLPKFLISFVRFHFQSISQHSKYITTHNTRFVITNTVYSHNARLTLTWTYNMPSGNNNNTLYSSGRKNVH